MDTPKYNIEDLPIFDAADYIDSLESAKGYVQEFIEDGTKEEFKRAIETVLRSKFMQE